MGYYSYVALALLESDYEELRNIPDISDDVIYLLDHADLSQKHAIEYLDDSKTVVFRFLYWDEVKWYGGCPEIAFLMKFIKSKDIYDYVRIGENDEDIEIDNKGNYHLLDILDNTIIFPFEFDVR